MVLFGHSSETTGESGVGSSADNVSLSSFTYEEDVDTDRPEAQEPRHSPVSTSPSIPDMGANESGESDEVFQQRWL